MPKHPVMHAASRIVMSNFIFNPLGRRAPRLTRAGVTLCAEYAPAPPFGTVARAYSGGQAESYSMKTGIDSGTVVTSAAPPQAQVIQNLMQLYTHDFSEFWSGTVRGDPNAEGLFDPYPLEGYWTNPNWSAMLIWCDQVLAGFSLVNDQTHSELAANRNMAEFFILRKHRGRGVGRIAAEVIFSQHPGLWEVAVARRNVRAREFWQKTIRGSAKASNVQELDLQNAHWNGPILRFEWGLGAPAPILHAGSISAALNTGIEQAVAVQANAAARSKVGY